MSQTIEEQIIYGAMGVEGGWAFSPKDFANFGGRPTINKRFTAVAA
jgi:hypothetical protein